jgi:hypothetical protein
VPPRAAEVVRALDIARDPDHVYFVRDGAVWRLLRRRLSDRPRRPELVARAAVPAAITDLHFLDADGQLARVERPGAPRPRGGGAKKRARPPGQATGAAALAPTGPVAAGAGRRIARRRRPRDR